MGGQRSGKRAALEKMILDAKRYPGSRLDTLFDDMHQQQVTRLHRPGAPAPEVHVMSVDEMGSIDQHLLDALKYGIGASQTRVAPETPAIEKHTNAEMVMEMLRRGFAVMKLPDDGGPPEVFRGTTERE